MIPNDLGYTSHFPVLAAAVARTSGPVLELGCGWASTPMLRLMCQRRILESYDNDLEWATQFGAFLVKDWSQWAPIESHYDVVFIDCAPSEERKNLAVRLKDRARYILCHDYGCDAAQGGGGNYGYDSITNQFKFVRVYSVVRPLTLILSNEEDFIL